VEVRDSSADKMNFSDLKKRKYTHSREFKECLGVHREIETELANNNCFVLGRTRQHTQGCVHKTRTSRLPRITSSPWGLMNQSEGVLSQKSSYY
jgi:hypothetical protein